MKIGDKVSFLSETGGGTVAGFQGKNIVLVEDEDGFQIPTPINDVVLVGQQDYSTKNVVSDKQRAAEPSVSHEGKSVKALMQADTDVSPDELTGDDLVDIDQEITYRKPVEERKGGDKISCYLAFVPIDSKNMSTTRFEAYLVNDCNYYLQVVYMLADGANWTLHYHGEVEPNTKTFIEEFGREDLNNMMHVALQLLAYKRDKPFMLKPSMDVRLRLDPVKFYKLHTFQPNDFFEQPALLYPLVENDKLVRPLSIDAARLKAEMYGQEDAPETAEQPAPAVITKRRGDEDVIVVDLHADALLDSTAGMSHSDILSYQLKKFDEVLAKYKDSKGQKLIFIHGKGNGVLRHSIINALNYRYKKYQYQDASFQEYGYGATQVTIR